MPSRDEITYFGAGPALLPTDVLERAAQALVNYNGTGLGLAEHSHRSELASGIVRDARADLAAFLDVPTDEYEVVIMQGGGTGEFAAVVYNLVGAWVVRERGKLVAEQGLPDDDTSPALLAALRSKVDAELRLDYLVTGSWSLKAYQEAQRLLGPDKVNLLADARTLSPSQKTFGALPDEAQWVKRLSPNAALVYFCDNETVDGVEMPQFPAALATASATSPPVVADMSSNILSRPVPVRSYGAFFFGAQKNLGSTGITVAVVKRSLLPQPSAALLRALGLPIGPIVLSYETIAKNDSLYNTLSIFEYVLPVVCCPRILSSLRSLCSLRSLLTSPASTSPARSSRSCSPPTPTRPPASRPSPTARPPASTPPSTPTPTPTASARRLAPARA